MEIDNFSGIMLDKCGIDREKKVLVGLSGGADSQCLLHLLVSHEYHAVAAHFNHHLRPEADAEAVLARSFAEQLGCEFLLGTEDVEGYADSRHLSLEEAARILRYSFLFAEAERIGAAAVAVAHQADDQVETMLMHLLRGSGSSGLKAMAYRSADPLGISSVPLIRPLLGTWREEIEEYCRKNNFTPAVDQSNFDVSFYRNRIRLELIPELETYNPQVKKHLWQTAFLLGEENDLLDGQASPLLERVILDRGAGWILADLEQIREAPAVFQRKTIRSIIFSLRNSIRDVDFDMVQRVTEFIHASRVSSCMQLSHGVDVVGLPDQRGLFMLRSSEAPDIWPQVKPGTEITVKPGSNCALNGDWTIRVWLCAPGDSQVQTGDRWSAFLDAEKLPKVIKLSTRMAGDVFEPFGMQGKTIKLGDFWTNEHLPARARDAWPVLRGDGKILWIPGFRIADSYRVTDATRQVLVLKVTRSG